VGAACSRDRFNSRLLHCIELIANRVTELFNGTSETAFENAITIRQIADIA
jgi:hypothetical protein